MRLAALLLGGACAALAYASDYRQFPGAPTDDRTLRIQERVEEIYASGNHERALLIYEKELAPAGDKYAQYMVGFMHLAGEGVVEDPVEALAWYRLAAERGESSLVEAREALAETLPADQLERSWDRFADLWRRYGDRRLIMDLVEDDLALLERQGGRGIDANGGARLATGYSGQESGDPVARRVRDRIQERMEYLRSHASPESVGIAADDSRIKPLEVQMRRIQQDLQAAGLR